MAGGEDAKVSIREFNELYKRLEKVEPTLRGGDLERLVAAFQLVLKHLPNEAAQVEYLCQGGLDFIFASDDPVLEGLELNEAQIRHLHTARVMVQRTLQNDLPRCKTMKAIRATLRTLFTDVAQGYHDVYAHAADQATQKLADCPDILQGVDRLYDILATKAYLQEVITATPFYSVKTNNAAVRAGRLAHADVLADDSMKSTVDEQVLFDTFKEKLALGLNRRHGKGAVPGRETEQVPLGALRSSLADAKNKRAIDKAVLQFNSGAQVKPTLAAGRRGKRPFTDVSPDGGQPKDRSSSSSSSKRKKNGGESSSSSSQRKGGNYEKEQKCTVYEKIKKDGFQRNPVYDYLRDEGCTFESRTGKACWGKSKHGYHCAELRQRLGITQQPKN
jgi:hypothetical protein